MQKDFQANERKTIDLQEVRNGDEVRFVPAGEVAVEDSHRLWWQSGGIWWSLVIVLAIMIVLAILLLPSNQTTDEPEFVAAEVVSTEDKIFAATYVEKNIEYKGCGHTDTSLLQGDGRFVDKSFSQLESEGWEVSKIGSNKVRVTMAADGFCDVDSQKRTLRLTEKGVGVYEGPKDKDGQLLNEMVLDTNQLPSDLLSMLKEGGVEFANEEELLETLDTLDEYVSYEYEGYYSGVV